MLNKNFFCRRESADLHSRKRAKALATTAIEKILTKLSSLKVIKVGKNANSLALACSIVESHSSALYTISSLIGCHPPVI